MGRFSRRDWFFLSLTLFFFLVQAGSSLWAQGTSGERIFFHAKVFTGDPQHPYAEAVAVRGEKILAVGSLPEVVKATSARAERVDLQGRSLFPGFVDSHSHSIDGGLNLISADASDKVHSLEELPRFVEDAKKTGRVCAATFLRFLACRWSFGPIATSLMPNSAPGHTRSKALFCAGWMGIRRGRIGRCCNVQASRQIF